MSESPQAFPSGDKAAFPTATYEPGMTLRDWFAGQALAGVLASGAGEDDSDALRRIIADDAYGYADAMLAARGDQS